MKKYVNRLGMTRIEPKPGYLLRRVGDYQTFKSVLLGKNDRAELYEEVVDPNYIQDDAAEEIPDLVQPEELYILTSPSGKRFKLTVSDDGDLDLEEL